MKNISFVLWMLGYPLLLIIDEYVVPYNSSETVESVSALIKFIIWIFVGYLVYEGRNTK